MPIDIQRTRETFLDHVDSAQWDTKVAAALAPHLSISCGMPVVVLHDPPDHAPWTPVNFVVAYSLEVRMGDQVLGTGRGRMPWGPYARMEWEEAKITWAPGAVAKLFEDNISSSIVVRADMNGAADAFMERPFEFEPLCWAGTFTAPLEVRRHPRGF